jgi:hypothetical protein
MTNSPSTGGGNAAAAQLTVEADRVRVKVRRRRARQGQQPRWTARARRQTVQMAFVCAGALLLMAAALYLSLSHQSAGPEGSGRGMVVGAHLSA